MLKSYSILLFTLFSATNYAQKFDHSAWNDLLKAHVSNNGNVNYKAIKQNITHLNSYLDQFAKTSPSNDWSKNEKLAYWINAYNSFTVKLILDNYPLKSIKEIYGPWDRKFIPIGGKKISLNHIEHEVLRKMDEPRIHFAIVCASYSCPILLNKAFNANNLEEQLTSVTKAFLTSDKNSISKDKIEISKIFKWFSGDFKKNGTLIDFLNAYSEIEISPNAKKSYKDYNWSLNE